MAADRVRLRVWLAALVVALGVGALVALTLRVAHDRRAPHIPASSTNEEDAVATSGPPRLRSPGGSVVPDDPLALPAYYGASAGDPLARINHEAALDAILREPDLPLRLFALLNAVEADATPPEVDPLWSRVAHGLFEIWQQGMARHGLDLMVMESRPRVRRAITSSFSLFAKAGAAKALPASDQLRLTDRFIDVYSQSPPMQRAEMQEALRATDNGDVAAILEGKGLHSDDELEIHRTYKQALQEGLHASASP